MAIDSLPSVTSVPIGTPHPEIGRELKTDELKERMLVLLNAAHRPNEYASLWVMAIHPNHVAFYAGLSQTTLMLYRGPDGALFDDGGRRLRVFEYLGADARPLQGPG